jgi:hypothetical protein
MTTVMRAVLALCLLLLPVTSTGLEVTECCVCDADCPTAGARVCFNVANQSECESACQAAGCGTEMGICIPGDPCDQINFCAETGEVRCSDGLDNNDNGLTDCQESACVGSPACQVGVPVMSGPVGGLLALLLGVGGTMMARRRLRRA